MNLREVNAEPRCAANIAKSALTEWVAHKGYHSNATMEMVDALGLRSYVSEPARGQRRWKDNESARDGTYANRRRLATKRGKALMKKRGELLERAFGHCLETGAMRRVHMRGRANILKRYLVHVAGFNLSLVMRQIFGTSTPRELRGCFAALAALWREVSALVDALAKQIDRTIDVQPNFALATALNRGALVRGHFSTGC